jgi:hypothetical protein
MKTPVLFLIFNRPQTTSRVFGAIRRARPERLYVAADGARASRGGEAERVAETRRIANSVDWPCRVATLFRDENLGCKRAVSSAIDWLFENESEGIILEDDTVPIPSFFTYAEALLERYRDDDRVMMINGSNLISQHYRAPHSYFMSSYAHVWGWASWRRAWQHYDIGVVDWPELKAADELAAMVVGSRRAWRRHWYPIFDAVHAGRIDTWDYQWTYALLKRRGLALTPKFNLVRNIGFGTNATHTIAEAPEYIRLAITKDLAFPLNHPAWAGRDRAADRIEETYIYREPLYSRVVGFIASWPFASPAISVARRIRDFAQSRLTQEHPQ